MNEIQKLIPAGAECIALSPKGTVMLRSVGEAAGFAALMASSGMLPPKVTPQAAVVAIIAGAAVGLNPFESVQSIAVVNGRPSLYGDGMKAVVQGSGVWEGEKVEWYKDKEGNIVACQVTVKRKGNPEPIVGRFSKKMAQQAGLWGKPGPWTQYPDRMMLARARAFALRDGFSDCLKGVRSVEEEQDILLASESDSPFPVQQSIKPRRTRRASAAEIIEAETADSSAGVLPTATEADAPEAQLVETAADEADFLKAS
jgi:hypothetical protein